MMMTLDERVRALPAADYRHFSAFSNTSNGSGDCLALTQDEIRRRAGKRSVRGYAWLGGDCASAPAALCIAA